MTLSFVFILALAASVRAHTGFWARGMYCKGGNAGKDDQNSNAIVQPLFKLPFNQWWFHHVNNCDQFPPPEGEFLELPAGGSFTGEFATNRAFTTLAFEGKYTGDWPDGVQAPIFSGGCITQPLIHAKSQDDAAGTAMAIAYVSELSQVTPQNLAVFTVRYHTPYYRVVNYDVPKAMPPCPPGGCICGWGWVPNHCGEPNMYMQAFKCNVTGSTSTTPIAPPQPPVWCEGDPSACVKGSKQMIYMNQLDGNNIDPNNGKYQADGQFYSPGYNMKLGFYDGAQNDIFENDPSHTTTTSTQFTTTSTTSTTTSTSTTSTSTTTTSTTTTSPTTTSTTSHSDGGPPYNPGTTTSTTTTSSESQPHTTPSMRTSTTSKPHRPHMTSKDYPYHTTSSHRPSHSGKHHCSNKSRRAAIKRHLEKRANISPHQGIN